MTIISKHSQTDAETTKAAKRMKTVRKFDRAARVPHTKVCVLLVLDEEAIPVEGYNNIGVYEFLGDLDEFTKDRIDLIVVQRSNLQTCVLAGRVVKVSPRDAIGGHKRYNLHVNLQSP